MTSIQGSKPCEKQISPTFSYFLINNELLYHFLANWLAHNKKMTEKSVFCEVWSPELTSQSFPVFYFWCHSFVPHQKWNLTLLAHQNMGKENRYRKIFFATLISTLGRFNWANKKKICRLHLKEDSVINSVTLVSFSYHSWVKCYLKYCRYCFFWIMVCKIYFLLVLSKRIMSAMEYADQIVFTFARVMVQIKQLVLIKWCGVYCNQIIIKDSFGMFSAFWL